MDRLHERVLRLNVERPFFDEMKVWGAVFYPQEEGERRAWESCAGIGLISSLRHRRSFEDVTFWEHLLPDLWDLRQSLQDRVRTGFRRWTICKLVAEVVLLTLWCRRNNIEYRNLEHWRHWITAREGLSQDHLRNRFTEFKDSSHLTAALMSTPWHNAAGEKYRASENPMIAALIGDYRLAMTLDESDFKDELEEEDKDKKVSVLKRLVFLLDPLQDKAYLETVFRRAEVLRMACQEQKILSPRDSWIVADVQPIGEFELEAPPQEAFDWLAQKFPRRKRSGQGRQA